MGGLGHTTPKHNMEDWQDNWDQICIKYVDKTTTGCLLGLTSLRIKIY